MQVGAMIDFCLRYHSNIQAAVDEKRLDPGTPKQGGGGHCYISDPTAMLALRHCAEVQCVVVHYGPFLNGRQESRTVHWPERWLRVVARTKNHVAGQVQAELIRLKFDEGLDRVEILPKIHVGRTTYHQMLDGIFEYAEGVADGLGLVNK